MCAVRPGAWDAPAPCSPGPLPRASAPSSSSGKLTMELLRPCNARRSSFNRCSRRRLRSRQRRDLGAKRLKSRLLSFEQHPQGRCHPGSTMPAHDRIARQTLPVNKIRDRSLRHAADRGGPEAATPGANRDPRTTPRTARAKVVSAIAWATARQSGLAQDASSTTIPSHHRAPCRSRRLGRNTTTTKRDPGRARARPWASCPLRKSTGRVANGFVRRGPRVSCMNCAYLARVPDHDPWRRTRNNHRRARSAAAISAIRKAPISPQGVPSRRAPRSTPNRPNPDPASPAKAGSDLPARRPRDQDPRGEDGEV